MIEDSNLEEETKEMELMRKDEITIYGKAMEQIKDFSFVIRILMVKFYQPYLNKEDTFALKEDLLRLAINRVMTNEIFKILLCLMRVETFSLDRDIRIKYDFLKKHTPEDFGVDPYLTLNPSSYLIDEVQKNTLGS